MRKVTITKHDSQNTIHKVPNIESWSVIARDLLKSAKSGSIIAIQGSLGAGKTTFVQAIAKELGIKKTPQSPTFSLLRSYPIPKHKELKRLVHVDAYRIEDERDLLALDLDEELSLPGTLLVIEWPEKIPRWISNHDNQITNLQVLVQ